MVNKLQKTVFIYFIIIGVILFLSAKGGINLPFSITGGIVKSVSLINSISNDADIPNSFFRTVTEVGVGEESIIAQYNAADFNSKLSPTFQTTFDLEILSNIREQIANYPIRIGTSDDVFYQYGLIIQENPFGPSDAPSCPNTGQKITVNGNGAGYKPSFGSNRYCIVKTYTGRYGDLQEPTIKVNADVILKSGNRTITKTLTNFGEGSGQQEFYDEGKLIARATLSRVGKSAGANPPSINSLRTLYLNNNHWQIIERSDYDNYNREIAGIGNPTRENLPCTTFEKSTFGGILDKSDACLTRELPKLLFNLQNTASDILTRQVTLSGGKYDISQNGESSSIVEYKTTDIKLTDVEIVVDVNAGWIGVKSVISRPEITNIQCRDFTQNGIIDVTVKSKDAKSSFDVNLEGCGKIRQTSDVSQKEIDKGEETVFHIPIDTADISAVSETCKVRAYNAQKNSLYDEDNVKCKAIALGQCTSGDKSERIIGSQKCIFICKNDGFYPIEANSCVNIDSGLAAGAKVKTTECKWYDIGCQINKILKETLNFLIYLEYFIIIIGSVLVAFISFDFLERIKTLRINKGLRTIFAIAIGGGIGYALYLFIGSFFFWAISVGIILYIIFGSIIKRLL